MKAVTGGALGVLVLGLVAWGVVRQVGESRDDTVVMPIAADAAYAINGPLSCDRELREVPHLPLEAEPVAFLLCADPDGSGPWISPEDLVEGDLAPLIEVLGRPRAHARRALRLHLPGRAGVRPAPPLLARPLCPDPR